MSTVHSTTVSLTVLILTWRTQMSCVHSIALVSSVEHASRTSVMSLEHPHVVCGSCFGLHSLPLLGYVVLVVLLMVLNLTVSVGTINGLIFYENIVRANHATFFPRITTNSFLSWFIAWMNLPSILCRATLNHHHYIPIHWGWVP